MIGCRSQFPIRVMIELLSNEEMAEADRLTIAAGTVGIDLMENAGRAVADAVALRQKLGTSIVVVAGPGNNGGDGFVAARLLSERGFRVRLLSLGDRDCLRGDAAEAARRFRGPAEPAAPNRLADAALIIDAIFGAARLAGRGALRAGAGLVTIASPREALAVNAAANLAVMVRAVDGAAELAAMLEDRRLNAVVLGPGGGVGAPMRELVASALAA